MAESCNLLIVLLPLLCFPTPTIAFYNIADFGAKADGRTDAATALTAAWNAACAVSSPATVVVPDGEFLVSRAVFEGPCKNEEMRVLVKGRVVAGGGFSGDPEWITFKYVTGLTVDGGIFDGRGQALWACKAGGGSCPVGSTALTISRSKNVHLTGITVTNSQNFQIGIIFSAGVTVSGATVTAPENSPNTDGIHIHMSSGVRVAGSAIRTGDDCISIGEGVSGAWIENIECGPGHGISVGSLGGSPGNYAGVQNVTVRSVVFTGTQNGFRVKTWATPYQGFVRGVTFQNASMDNVQNPILIDQNYCPGNNDCPNQSSGIKISNVFFGDVHGTSATPVSIKLDCSSTNPCRGVELQNINLSYNGNKAAAAESVCNNVQGKTSGVVIPQSCL